MKSSGRIDRDRTVVEVAQRLGIHTEMDLLRAIPDAVERKVDAWLTDCGVVPETLEDVHRFVLNRTRLKVHRVEIDDDIRHISSLYQTEIPNLGIQLALEFGRDGTEAVLMRRPGGGLSGRYVAIIDAREERARRAWYAERHEAAHLLVDDPSVEEVWRRSGDASPIERVVDAVAARVGFWPEVVRPVVHRVRPTVGIGLLDALAGCRASLAPEASTEASLRSFALYLNEPTLFVYCDMASRKAEERFGCAAPSFRLRVRAQVSSPSARSKGLFLPTNFSVPMHSIIHSAFDVGPVETLYQDDCLGNWSDSSGKTLRALPIRIEAQGRWAVLTLR